MLGIGFALGLCRCYRLCHSDYRRHVERARAHTAFLTAAVDERRYLGARIYIQEPRALHSVKLMRRYAQHVDARFGNVYIASINGLHRVGEHQRAHLVRDLGQLFYRLDSTDYVIDGHHAHYRRIVAYHRSQRVGRDYAVGIRLNDIHVVLGAELVRARKHGVVLYRRNDYMRSVRRRRAFERPVDGFRTAGSKVYALELCAYRLRAREPCRFHGARRFLPRRVQRRRVIEIRAEIRHRGGEHVPVDGRRRRMIEIDLYHSFISISANDAQPLR